MDRLLNFRVAGTSDRRTALLSAAIGPIMPNLAYLVNADDKPDPAIVIARCRAFAAETMTGGQALIVTLLHAAPAGLDHLDVHTSNAALWSFIQQAALAWAPHGIRVNAIGLGVGPAGPFEATEQSGRAAAPIPAHPADLDDIARTLRAIAGFPSMTGQIIRLGA